MKHRITLVLLLILLGATGCQTTPRATSGSVEVATDDLRLKLYFTDQDKALISRYYSHGKRHKHKKKQMPPGLAKKGKLPPGLQKQLVRNGRLPPGLEGRHLPLDLERNLRRLPDDYIRLRVGTDIVLINKHTRVIFDILLDAAIH